MSHQLTLEVPDALYEPMRREAAKAGQPLETWVLDCARARVLTPEARVLTPEARAAALAQLMRHAGAVDLGHPTGADNESIDADLARAYADPHEDRP
jgi:hypothetical protein